MNIFFAKWFAEKTFFKHENYTFYDGVTGQAMCGMVLNTQAKMRKFRSLNNDEQNVINKINLERYKNRLELDCKVYFVVLN